MSLEIELAASVDKNVEPGDAVYYAKVIMSAKYHRQKRVYVTRTVEALKKKLEALELSNSLKRHTRKIKVHQVLRLPTGQIPEWRLPATHAPVYVAIPNREIVRDCRADRPKASQSLDRPKPTHDMLRETALQIIAGGYYTINDIELYKYNGWITDDEFEEARKQLELN